MMLMTSRHSLMLNDPAETESFGRRLGQALFPGAVVALVGQLGAGKTYLVRAIAEGLGIDDPNLVGSPTFVLIQEYNARLPIYHFDAYRLGSEAEFAELGVHEYLDGGGVCLIEWADKVRGVLPEQYLELALHITGPEARRVDVLPRGSIYEQLVASITS
jgi:tRNA threonylcarbamoyladenosine biosynthesis protein TsaE